MNGLKGRVAVVTGAGGGIGRATSVALAKEGVKLVLLGGNCAERLAETERAVAAAGAECLSLGGDLTDMDFLAKGVNAAAEKMGGSISSSTMRAWRTMRGLKIRPKRCSIKS